MSTTVIEALENSKCNIETLLTSFGINNNMLAKMALEQLQNGIDALENGFDCDDIITEK